MQVFDAFLTYDLPGTIPNKHGSVKRILGEWGLSDTVKGAGLPDNTLHIKMDRKDAATVIRQIRDYVKFVFEREHVTGPFLIVVVGSDGVWEKGHVPNRRV
jgi:hypothetical protein